MACNVYVGGSNLILAGWRLKWGHGPTRYTGLAPSPPALALALIERLKIIPDAWAARDTSAITGAWGTNLQGDLSDRADILRDVFAGFAIRARSGLHQHAVFSAGSRASPSNLSSATYSTGPSASVRPSSFRMRASNCWAPLASVSVSVRILSMGTRMAHRRELFRVVCPPAGWASRGPIRVAGFQGRNSWNRAVVLGIRYGGGV